jgi:hypothetical protein
VMRFAEPSADQGSISKCRSLTVLDGPRATFPQLRMMTGPDTLPRGECVGGRASLNQAGCCSLRCKTRQTSGSCSRFWATTLFFGGFSVIVR